MKRILTLTAAFLLVLSMSLTAFAANNQTEVSLTLEENMETYTLVIPPTVIISPAEKTGKVEVKIQNINLVWSKGINLYVKAQNSDANGDYSSFLINAEDSSKKIGYDIYLGSNILYSAKEYSYNTERGLLTNIYSPEEYSDSWARYPEEINLKVTGEYPGSGTYTDTLTFTVELGDPVY